MESNQFPVSMEWVGLVLAIIGVVVAMPWILSLIFGDPELKAFFDSCEVDNSTVLGCEICNPPIIDGCLYYLGARRQTALGVRGQWAIEEPHSSRVLYRGNVLFVNDDLLSGGSSVIDIPPSESGLSIGMIQFYEGSKFAHVYGEIDKKLFPGQYRVYMSLESGGKSWSFEKDFSLTRNNNNDTIKVHWMGV